MSDDVYVMHFYFPKFRDASQATQAWLYHQAAKGMTPTLFNINAVGKKTNVSVHPDSIGDQDEVLNFFAEHFSGKYSVHDTNQVSSWLDDSFA